MTNSLYNAANARYINITLLKKDFIRLEKKLYMSESRQELSESKARKGNWDIIQLDNGAFYEGNLVKGLREGRGKQIYADREIYEGEWKHGKRHGYGELKKGVDTVCKGEWVYDEQIIRKKNGEG